MSRALRLLALVLATVLAAGCAGSDTASPTTTGKTTADAGGGGKITLRGASTNTGPWVQSLSLEHGADGVPTSFYVCAAWDSTRAPEGCDAAPGANLPAGTTLRLEQHPIGNGQPIADSPGWGTVGTSAETELHVPLSDFVSGLKVPKATYRVTLRRLEGGSALGTSNSITVAWGA